MYAKFQLHPPYGFWAEDFWILFSKIYPLSISIYLSIYLSISKKKCIESTRGLKSKVIYMYELPIRLTYLSTYARTYVPIYLLSIYLSTYLPTIFPSIIPTILPSVSFRPLVNTPTLPPIHPSSQPANQPASHSSIHPSSHLRNNNEMSAWKNEHNMKYNLFWKMQTK